MVNLRTQVQAMALQIRDINSAALRGIYRTNLCKSEQAKIFNYLLSEI